MHLHILGICGTFMAGIAALARAEGHRVTGSDAQAYPPMSTQLADMGIEVMQGYDPAHLDPAPDVVVVGNVVSRGNEAMEHVLNARLPYVSGPQWLSEHVLRNRHVLAVAGTHGKTTTSGMLAWILESASKAPGFLIGGVPGNFDSSAVLGEGDCFVVEADEYDTAFFDKRSKFVHYRPSTLILNNLEFDHADIFDNLAAIQRQFHHLVRTVPGQGRILSNAAEPNLDAVLEMGCWSEVQRFVPPASNGREGQWQVELGQPDGSQYTVTGPSGDTGKVSWGLLGDHNVANGLAAVAAASHVGVDVAEACAALSKFVNAKRRMQLRGEVNGIRVYDDFAHHPTAITTTLKGLRDAVGDARILAVLEPRSNTMRMGVHRDTLAKSLSAADRVWMLRPSDVDWDPDSAMQSLGDRLRLDDAVTGLVSDITAEARSGDHVVIMSNGDFGGIHEQLLEALDR